MNGGVSLGGGGAGEDAKAAGEISRAKKKGPTFGRLWAEAKQESGHLAMATTCLLVSSSMNLLAPSIMAR